MKRSGATAWAMALFLTGCSGSGSPTAPPNPAGSPAPAPTPVASAGLVSLNFDDGFISGYNVGVPMLEQYHFPATFYIVSRYVGFPAYMDKDKIVSLASRGYEIGAHTRTHTDLVGMNPTQLRDEVIDSRQVVEAFGIRDIQTFAYPFGSYDGAAIEMVKEGKYLAARSVDSQMNTSNTDRYALHAFSINDSYKLAEVQRIIDDAQSSNAWLILVFHRFNEDGQSTSTRQELFKGILDYLVQKKIQVVTLRDGLSKSH